MKGIWVGLAAICIYAISVFGGFIQDDVRVVRDDRSLGSMEALISSWTTPYYKNDEKSGAYRPATSFSFGLNAVILGKGAWGFRLVNILLYGVLCWWVYKYLEGLLRNGKLALGIALLFAVHPIHTEAVNNIVGRAEILSLLFILWSVMAAGKKKWELSSLWFLLAMLSKESAIVAVVLLGWTVTKGGGEVKEKIGRGLYFLMAMGGYWLLRLAVLGSYVFSNNASMVENPLKFLPAVERIRAALAIFPMGVSKLILPWYLSYDYSFNQIKLPMSFGDLRVLIGVSLIIISGIVLWWGWKKKGIVEGLMFFWLPLLVTGNIIFPTGTIFGERLWMTPSLGFLMLTVLGAYYFIQGLKVSSRRWWQRAAYYLLIFMVVMWGLRTVMRNIDWLSPTNLFLHDAKYMKDSVMVASNEAAMRYLDKDLEGARKALERGEKIYPKYPPLMNNWGMYYWGGGEVKKAREKFELCVEEVPEYYLCQENLRGLKAKSKI